MIWMCQLPPSLELMATAHRFAILTLYSPYPDTHMKACLIFSYWTQCCLNFAQLQCVQCSDMIMSLILIFSLSFVLRNWSIFCFVDGQFQTSLIMN